MEESEILQFLIELAGEAGIEVRIAGRGPSEGDELPPVSGVCRVRGAVWVVLSRAEPLAAQTDVLARALKEHAAALLETRYLPPAVRCRIDPQSECDPRPA